MKPKFANSKPLYRIVVEGKVYRPDLVFVTVEDAQRFTEKHIHPSYSVSIEPVKIVIGLEEDEHDRLEAEKKTLEAKLAEVNKKLGNDTQPRTGSFDDLVDFFLR
jgi:hypothetical protein